MGRLFKRLNWKKYAAFWATLLILPAAFAVHAVADTDEKEAALQAAQLEELLRCAFGEDSQERVLAYEACELDGELNGKLYAVCRADGIQTLHIVRREDGVIVSHLVSDSSLLRKDAVPILYVETEGELNIIYPDDEAGSMLLVRDAGGAWTGAERLTETVTGRKETREQR